MGHTANSPSTFYRRRLCPGSKAMEAKFPDTDSPASLKGTAAHKALDICFTENKTPGYFVDFDIKLVTNEEETHDERLAKEDTEALWVCYDYVEKRREQMSPDVFLETEVKVDPGVWQGRDDVAGSLDCCLTHFYGNGTVRAIEVIDYKHGSGHPVEAADNDQLAQYIIGKLASINWENPEQRQDIPVTGTIVQPRCPHDAGPIRSWTEPAQYWFTRCIENQQVLAQTDDPDAPRIPGEEQCLFCRAKAECPERVQEALSAFSPLEEKKEVSEAPSIPNSDWETIEKSLGRPVEVLSFEEQLAIYEKADMLRAWLTDLDKAMQSKARSGEFAKEFRDAGYKLVKSTKHRKWEQGDEAVIKKLASLRDKDNKVIGKSAACVTKPLSPLQAEKQIRPKISERQWKTVEKMIITPEGPPVLAPLTDPRPEVLAEVFEPIFTPISEQNPFG